MNSFPPTGSDGLWFWTRFLVLVLPIVGCLVYILFKAWNIIFTLLKLLLVLLLVVYSPQWIGCLIEMLEWSPFLRLLMASCTLSFTLYKLRLPGKSTLKLGGRIIFWAISGISLTKQLIDSNGHLFAIGMLRVLAWIFCFGLAAHFPFLLSGSTRLGTAILNFVSLFIIWIDFTNRTPFTLSLVIGHTLVRLISRRQSPSVPSEHPYQNERTYSAVLSAASDYLYEPLDLEQKEFRLLTLLPGKISHLSDPIECQIGHFSLGRSPPYFALSYQWGNPERTKEIKLGGVPFKITASLDLALRCLRFHRIKTLWIDAICINQNNNSERNIQVERMFDIYKHGKGVAVWLGTHDRGSSRVMDSLMNGKLKDFDDGTFNLLSPAEKNQIDHFLSRKYWERVWIIQEIAAGENVTLFCGQDVIYWENLERLGMEWPRFRPNVKPFQPVKTLCEIRASRRQMQTKKKGLVEILALTTHSKSSDPLDKVYGLLGLASDCDLFVTMPDYDLNPTELCLSMANAVIIKSQSLDIILLGSRGSFHSPLPSWCPDFVNFQPSDSDTALISYLSRVEKYRFGKLLRRWNTTGDSRVLGSNIEITNEILTIPGLRIGTVHALSCALNEDSSCLQQGTRTAISDSIDRRAFFDSLSRIMMMYDEEFKFYGEFPVHLGWLMSWAYPVMSKINGDAYSASVIRWLNSNRNLYIHGKTFSGWATSFRSNVQEVWNSWKGLFHARTKTMTTFTTEHLSRSIVEILEEGFRLMACDHGRVGWAHKDSKIGDHIFLFGGCTLPVILRPNKRGKGYTLVGHAYIDGVMDNQVWKNRGVTSLTRVVIY